MKKAGIFVVIILIVLVGGYLGRHKLKALFMGPAPTPTPQVIVKISPTQAQNEANSVYKTTTDAKNGTFLTDLKGMTLYVFDKDSNGVSNCSGQCLAIWPAYGPGSSKQPTLPSNISVIKRSNGVLQFAWKGKPLYYYAKDSKAGDTFGDGIGGIWHIIKL